MPGGRPRKEIDKKDFEGLLAIQCTEKEVVAFFDHKLGGCSKSTIERWCKREYKKDFDTLSREKRELGKISLRRAQFELAKKSAAMAIWLGKNYLDQKDVVEYENKEALERLDRILNGIFDKAEQETE